MSVLERYEIAKNGHLQASPVKSTQAVKTNKSAVASPQSQGVLIDLDFGAPPASVRSTPPTASVHQVRLQGTNNLELED
jgi:hypothetical protein